MKTTDILLFNDFIFVTMNEDLNGHNAATFTQMDTANGSFIIINLSPSVIGMLSNEDVEQVILLMMKEYKNYIGAATLKEAMTHYMESIAPHVKAGNVH